MQIAIVNPSVFQSGNEDRNGRKPLILDPVFGEVPFRRIINGTLAFNAGLEVGKTYLVKIEMVDNTNPDTGVVSKQPQVTRLGDGALSATEIAINTPAFIAAYGMGRVAADKAINSAPKVTEEQDEAVDFEGNPVPKDDDKPF